MLPFRLAYKFLKQVKPLRTGYLRMKAPLEPIVVLNIVGSS